MKKLILLLIVLMSFSTHILSCGNEYGYTLDGEKQYTRYFFLSERMLSFNYPAIQKKINTLALKLNSDSTDTNLISKYAITKLEYISLLEGENYLHSRSYGNDFQRSNGEIETIYMVCFDVNLV